MGLLECVRKVRQRMVAPAGASVECTCPQVIPYLRSAKLEKLERKVKVAAVSYLNTKPLLKGFEGHPMLKDMELSVDFPSRIGTQLIEGKVDLGLVPVAVLPRMKQFYIQGSYCIGATAAVASVCIFSERPIQELRALYLDYQSFSSVALARYLLRDFWNLEPELLPAAPGYEDRLTAETGGVVIGDRALQLRSRYPYCYDLAEAWIRHQGLPFVFAAWISNKALDPGFVRDFDAATGYGTQGPGLEAVLREQTCSYYDLRTYYTRNISYCLDAAKREGLDRFQRIMAGQLKPGV